jgi:hypothetical protein
MIVTVETSDHGTCPHWFTSTDSNILADNLLEHAFHVGMETDVVGMLEPKLLVSLTPLQRVGSQFAGLSLEDWIQEGFGNNPEDWLKEEKREREAWQPPEVLADCLLTLIAELDKSSDVFQILL